MNSDFLTPIHNHSLLQAISYRLELVVHKRSKGAETIRKIDMAKDDKLGDKFDDIPHERKDPRPDFSTPPPRKRLPKEIQNTLDDDEKLWEVLYEGKYVDHFLLARDTLETYNNHTFHPISEGIRIVEPGC